MSHQRRDDSALALSEPEAAARLGFSPLSLKTMRCRGRGPRYRKIGRRVVYTVADLTAWLNRDDTVRETADTAHEAAARRRRRSAA